jgi:cob(I)alamin adenosyltransferase
MKIYTRTGDKGETGLFGGQRVRKDDLRIEACGAVDELNCALGLVRALAPSDDLDSQLRQIQNELFTLGADLATPIERDAEPSRSVVKRMHPETISKLEHAIDSLETELEPLKRFILPGGCALAAQIHFARTLCRRAERTCVTLASAQEVNGTIVTYLNRLSDLLFVMARVSNRRCGMPDVPWEQ